MAKKEAKDLKYGISKTPDRSAYNVAVQRKYYRPGVMIDKEKNQDMVEFLKSKESISDYIISLIRADMNKGKR